MWKHPELKVLWLKTSTYLQNENITKIFVVWFNNSQIPRHSDACHDFNSVEKGKLADK